MKTIAFYDDRLRPDEDTRSFLGVDRFSAIRFRKRTLLEHARDLLAAAGVDGFVVVSDADDAATAIRDLLGEGGLSVRVVIMPSAIVFADDAAARTVVAKMAFVDEPFQVRPPRLDGPTLQFLDVPQARLALLHPVWLRSDHAPLAGLHTLPDQVGLIDLTDRDRLIDLLNGTFDARHFNQIRQDGLLVTKRSVDVAKMRREHSFHQHLSAVAGPLRMYFLESLAFRTGPGWAEYDTERIGAPDAAIQWIHGSLDGPRFSRFLAKLGEFFRRRPIRPSAGGWTGAEALYLGKVADRQQQLRSLPSWTAIESILARALPAGGLSALTARFERQWRRLAARQGNCREAVTHGDLCLSNILYCRQSRLMKFIDPRGAEQDQDIWMERHYDLAKLSHSILGGYDFINHDLCDLELGSDLAIHLVVHAHAYPAEQAEFRALLESTGHDQRFVRACEASLFLSMLPLHADVPKKVVAFVLVAAAIVTELEDS